VPRSRPVDYLISGTWPDGELHRDAPIEAVYAQRISQHLVEALAGRSVIAIAREANLNRSTVQDLLAGRSCGQVSTVARLEQVLGRKLWPES
jgi:hypothetical protein